MDFDEYPKLKKRLDYVGDKIRKEDHGLIKKVVRKGLSNDIGIIRLLKYISTGSQLSKMFDGTMAKSTKKENGVVFIMVLILFYSNKEFYQSIATERSDGAVTGG